MNDNACNLNQKKCVPCEGNVKPLNSKEYAKFLEEIPEWKVFGETEIARDFKFKNFKDALKFVNLVGELSENEGHHPDILLHNWNKVLVSLTTHAIKGLSENDFIMASKTDLLFTS